MNIYGSNNQTVDVRLSFKFFENDLPNYDLRSASLSSMSKFVFDRTGSKINTAGCSFNFYFFRRLWWVFFVKNVQKVSPFWPFSVSHLGRMRAVFNFWLHYMLVVQTFFINTSKRDGIAPICNISCQTLFLIKDVYTNHFLSKSFLKKNMKTYCVGSGYFQQEISTENVPAT